MSSEKDIEWWRQKNAADFAAFSSSVRQMPEGSTIEKNFLVPRLGDRGPDYFHLEVFKTAERAAYVRVSQSCALELGDEIQAKLDKMFELFLR